VNNTKTPPEGANHTPVNINPNPVSTSETGDTPQEKNYRLADAVWHLEAKCGRLEEENQRLRKEIRILRRPGSPEEEDAHLLGEEDRQTDQGVNDRASAEGALSRYMARLSIIFGMRVNSVTVDWKEGTPEVHLHVAELETDFKHPAVSPRKVVK
jgi:hypothetical protein